MTATEARERKRLEAAAATRDAIVVLVTPVDQLRALGTERAERYVAEVVASVEQAFPRAHVEHRAVGAVARRVDLPELEGRDAEDDEKITAEILRGRIEALVEIAWARAEG